MTNNNKEITGIVLLNLGGPDSLQAVKPFLYNLFSDREIIRLGPAFLQKPIAWLIANIRSKKTEEMYNQIGGKSPIVDITTAQASALEKVLNEESKIRGKDIESKFNSKHMTPNSELYFKVYIGMKYWHPFIKATVNKIVKESVGRLVVLSLYPHYSKATTGSAFSDFKRAITNYKLQIEYIENWHDFSPYIESLAELVANGISKFQGNDFALLYSAHNLPESFLKKGDPYLDQIKTTIEKINHRLSNRPYKITDLKWHLSFQSKSGPVKWLKPSTDETIKKLANSGCKNLLVVPISFVSDHIETLYEIDILYKKIAKKYGINLNRCESLNTSERFINALKELIFLKIKNQSS